jgi:ABC-type uncharacterized transport system ATPase subunit
VTLSRSARPAAATGNARRPGGFALADITKAFGALIALDGVSVSAPGGSVHALIGENGAGKTTLMRILAGLERTDSGEVRVGDRTLSRAATPREAQTAGVGMVPQHCEVVPGLTVLENFALGWELSRRGILRRGELRTQAKELAGELGFEFRWDAPAETLGLGERQRLELLKVLWRDASIVVFDEPTTVLTADEVSGLLAVMRRLAGDGRSVIFISHKLEEVRRVADEVTVLRRGRVVARVGQTQIDERRLAEAMIGELVESPARDAAARAGHVRLALTGVSTRPARAGDRPLRCIDMELRAGEILGIAGIDGNGQRELCEVIVGLRGVTAGDVTLDGRPLSGRSVAQRRSDGIAWIPPDRMHEGVNRLASLWENVAAPRVAGGRAGRLGVLSPRRLRAHAAEVLAAADVRGSLEQPAGSLSGGNIQRLIVGRELAQSPVVLIAAHPTRGVDVRGIAFIHERLLGLRRTGCAVLVVSADLDELAAIADRVIVLAEGRIAGRYLPGEADPSEIGLMMSGRTADAARTPATGAAT